MNLWVQEAGIALRRIRRTPGFSAVVVLTLAIGIGANTAIFSVVHSILLRPLPYAESDRLVEFSERTPEMERISISYPNFLDWPDQDPGGFPEGYLPFLQAPNHDMTVVVKTGPPPEQLVEAARREVLAVDPGQPIPWMRCEQNDLHAQLKG